MGFIASLRIFQEVKYCGLLGSLHVPMFKLAHRGIPRKSVLRSRVFNLYGTKAFTMEIARLWEGIKALTRETVEVHRRTTLVWFSPIQ